MRTCEHCTKPIPASRLRRFDGYVLPTKYCSARCRRDASDKRVLPLCPICGINQLSHRHNQACSECNPRLWTHDTIIDAIRDYADQYGRPPGARDWNPSMARANYRDDIAERFYNDNCWPHTNTVQRIFGKWNTAIKAAGFTPVVAGHKYVDLEPRQPRHGTTSEYARGCRCDECRSARSAYGREYKRRRRAAGLAA